MGKPTHILLNPAIPSCWTDLEVSRTGTAYTKKMTTGHKMEPTTPQSQIGFDTKKERDTEDTCSAHNDGVKKLE